MVEHAFAMQQVASSIPAQVWWLLSVVRVGPYKRVPGSQTLKHTLQMLLLMGCQVARARLALILDIKELATPTLVRTQLVVHIFPPRVVNFCFLLY